MDNRKIESDYESKVDNANEDKDEASYDDDEESASCEEKSEEDKKASKKGGEIQNTTPANYSTTRAAYRKTFWNLYDDLKMNLRCRNVKRSKLKDFLEVFREHEKLLNKREEHYFQNNIKFAHDEFARIKWLKNLFDGLKDIDCGKSYCSKSKIK